MPASWPWIVLVVLGEQWRNRSVSRLCRGSHVSLKGHRRTSRAKLVGLFGVMAFSLLTQVMSSRVHAMCVYVDAGYRNSSKGSQ